MSRTILLVEDETVVRELVREMLVSQGYDVIAAGDPEAAVAVGRDPEQPIDLLVTDVMMPRMNGRDLARELSSARGGLKVLFMSGYSNEIATGGGVLEPGTDFLPKPFNARDLEAKIRSLLEA